MHQVVTLGFPEQFFSRLQKGDAIGDRKADQK